MHILLGAIASASLLLAAGAAMAQDSASIVGPEPQYGPDYALDRAMIEDLQARYLFAMDFRDAEAYAGTFAPDGVLVHANGAETGRAEIAQFIRDSLAREQTAAEQATADGLRRSKGSHNITSLALDIAADGQTARGVAYWVQLGNNNPERAATVGSYGHYEDELVKIDGRWFFSKREIYNEVLERRSAAGQQNPVRTIWSDQSTPTWLETHSEAADAPAAQ
jgi:ketosteroid isomerase-like protein